MAPLQCFLGISKTDRQTIICRIPDTLRETIQKEKNIMPLSTQIPRQQAWADKICYLFLVFLTGCLVGWIYEEIFYWITEGMLRNRGLLYGPWLPIYGIGTLGIYAMKPLKKYPLLLFALCVGISGLVEYVLGYIGLHLLGIRLWDYRGLLWNLDGLVCLRSVLSFGIMGLAFHYLLEPLAQRQFHKLRPAAVHTGCRIILGVFLLDCVLSALFRTPITY